MQVWLYEKLKKKGLSQAALARMIGSTPHSLCAKFCGRQPFLYREVEAICEILDIENPREVDWVEKKIEMP